MDGIEALHTAARHYCMEQAAKWHERYSELTKSGRASTVRPDGSWDYSAEACDVFPRYQTLHAIQTEVERLLPADFASVEDARLLLAIAGETARSGFTKFDDRVSMTASNDERGKFIGFIRHIDDGELARQVQLPFHRVLGTAEHKELHTLFSEKWGNWYGGCSDKPSVDAITIHVAALEESNWLTKLRGCLTERAICRVWELREHDEGFETSTDNADFAYNGAEGFWTSGDMEWMVYASHESSITFGSKWLIEEMRRTLPDFDRFIYKGWDLAAYGRSE